MTPLEPFEFRQIPDQRQAIIAERGADVVHPRNEFRGHMPREARDRREVGAGALARIGVHRVARPHDDHRRASIAICRKLCGIASDGAGLLRKGLPPYAVEADASWHPAGPLRVTW